MVAEKGHETVDLYVCVKAPLILIQKCKLPNDNSSSSSCDETAGDKGGNDSENIMTANSWRSKLLQKKIYILLLMILHN